MSIVKITRLGDILLEEGILTATQLHSAVVEQKRRREGIDPNDRRAMDASSLGEILIELGYITRQQLKRGLNWQLYLRKMTLVMSLCAPLMTLGSGATAASSNASSQSSKASATNSLPLVIQAENFTNKSGIQTEPTTDIGGGLNVGYFHENDWISYSGTEVNIPTTGNYRITYRVASQAGGGIFNLHEAGTTVVHDIISVPSTGGPQKWVNVVRTVKLTAGIHKFGITTIARGSGFNLNWFKVEAQGVALPAIIQAEDYSAMKGIQTEATSDTGGGENVGYFHPGDWLSYADTVISIPTTGTYKVTYRVSGMGSGASFSFHEADKSAQYDTVSVPNTGGPQKWVNVERHVTLTAGAHKFGITAIVRGGGFNINWIKIEKASSATSSQSSSRQSSSSSSSSFKSSSPIVSTPPKSVVSSSSVPTVGGVTGVPLKTIKVVGPARFSWNIPTKRENGALLDITELDGYEIRYRLISQAAFTYVKITDPWKNFHTFDWLEGDYIFQVAAYDENGIYSNFVDIAPN